MSTTPSPLAEIVHFHRINDQWGTAGQPAASQFPLLHAAGFQVVINLALATSDDAIPNEGSLVTALGMTYIHLPVNFQTPATQDFHRFCRIMEALQDQRVFIHCVANKRVSAFMYLYRILHQKAAPAEALRDLHALWEPDAAWQQFIEQQLRRKDLF